MHPVALILSLWLTPDAVAARWAGGVSGATSFSFSEPRYDRGAGPAGVLCGGLVGWALTGGHETGGVSGPLRRTADPVRWGGSAQLCPAAGGGRSGTLGVAYGRQWGNAMYVTVHGTAGLSIYGKSDDGFSRYRAYGLFVKPTVGVGISLPPGWTAEVGGYVTIAPPIVQDIVGDRPNGLYLGHMGLELSVMIGSASPTLP